jgi:spore maturation protein CgeB
VKIVIAGLSITSSWGNGHATTYRSLVRALAARGHEVLFFERDRPWYAENRDLPEPPYCRVVLYDDCRELSSYSADIGAAHVVIVGSYVPDGPHVIDAVIAAAEGCLAFYDIDTPVTLAALERGAPCYIDRAQIPAFDLYLSFTGGPTLERLERQFGARCARPLYCSVDPDVYYTEPAVRQDIDLGYLGTYSPDRQPAVDELLIRPARTWAAGRFVIAGAKYPAALEAPDNVERIVHLAAPGHRRFYNRQRFTLNVTRRDMIAAGYSPSVRLFEAAACGTPIISDSWPGLDTILTPGVEVLIAETAERVLEYLQELPDEERIAIGRRTRARVLAAHTATHRAIELEGYVAAVRGGEPCLLRA